MTQKLEDQHAGLRLLRGLRILRGSVAVLLVIGCVGGPRGPAPKQEPDAFLFSYFTRNGEDGLHLAYSRDGITWLPLNGARSLLTPAIEGAGRGWQEWNTRAAIMRDPSVLRGPDGVFHLVWTISWTDRAIGHATSRDLINWSAQERIPVMAAEKDTVLNTWAPDLFYDEAKREFVIAWASSIPGRFPATDSLAQRTSKGRADHRLYYVTTKDWKTFSPTRLLYDGGFCAIDGTITKKGDTYFLVMKDEAFFPAPTRNLRVATSKAATGPYGPAGPAFTARDTEGPSILHVDDWWYVYFDYYTRGRYGSRRTTDFTNWEVVSDSLRAPRGIRHGSAFLAPESVLQGLLKLDSLPR
jgi:beta-xylosidase